MNVPFLFYEVNFIHIHNTIKTDVFQDTKNIQNRANLPEYRVKPYGTAHAILCAKDYFNDKDGICVIIPGDIPLIDNQIINNCINSILKKLENGQIDIAIVTNDTLNYKNFNIEFKYLNEREIVITEVKGE